MVEKIETDKMVEIKPLRGLTKRTHCEEDDLEKI